MKRSLPMLSIAACLALLVAVLLVLFQSRYETGDVFPAYSSLRTDPLGTMVLYESLSAMPGLSVQRDTSSSGHLPVGRDTAYLHLAGSQYEWTSMPGDLVREIEAFVAGGGRLVVMFSPDFWTTTFSEAKKKVDEDKKKAEAKKKKEEEEEKKAQKKDADKKKAEEDEDAEYKPVDLSKRWGFSFDSTRATDKEKAGGYAMRKDDIVFLPTRLKWNGHGALQKLDASWQVIYTNDSRPVLAVKTLGRGTIVFATDSYLVSNEAMTNDRHAEFITWLIGGNHMVIFDEAHLGIADRPGLATLARKYHLYGVVFALAVLAGLFIWKNSLSMIPAQPEKEQGLTVAGRDSAAGFAALLRRSIPPEKLLGVCLEEWMRTTPERRLKQKEGAVLESIVRDESTRPARQQNLAAACREIFHILHPGLRPPSPSTDASHSASPS